MFEEQESAWIELESDALSDRLTDRRAGLKNLSKCDRLTGERERERERETHS